MKTRVTSQIPTQNPTEKQVESLIADLTAIQKRVEAFAIGLTAAERLSTLKMRSGGDKVVATLAQLATQTGVALPQVSGDVMAAKLAQAERLQPLAEAARQLTRRLDDSVLTLHGECWWAATALYTTLSRIAAANPGLTAALEPVVSFFAHRARKKTAPPVSPGPVTPPVTPQAPAPVSVN